ncbi:MAG: VCBS repeat-containing protein [Planctomycetes bacterium]|nr:VCBS repeat-containing protein [Planctomycetota bacterium]
MNTMNTTKNTTTPSPRVRSLSILLGLALAPCDLGAAAELVLDGAARAVHFADVDGDGDTDALVVTSREVDGRPERGVHVFLRTESGLSTSAARSVDVPRGVLFMDLADLDGDARVELLLVDPTGLIAVDLESDATDLTRVLSVESFFRAASSPLLPQLEVARDFDRDGILDVLLPSTAGYAYHRGKRGGEFEAPVAIAADARHGVRSGENVFFRATARLARASAIDWEGDGVGDLVLAFEEKMMRVVLAPGIAPAAATLLLDLTRVLAQEDQDAQGLVQTAATLRDVDRDGACDLLLTRRAARTNLLAGMNTRTLLFLAADLRTNGGVKPRQAIRTEGLSTRPIFADFDRDGADDLVLCMVKADALSKLKEQILDQADVTMLVFPFDRDEHRFASEPIASESLVMPTSALLEFGAAAYVTFTADYDADGRPDFASYDARSKRLTVRRCISEDGLFSSTPIAFDDDPYFETTIDLPGPFDGVDTNGDGKPEIVSCGGARALIVEVKP